MHDGKYLSVEAGHGYTGWDVGGYVDYSYANSFNEIVKLGLTKDAREDLKDQLLEYALNEKGKDLARNRKKPKKKTARKSSKK
jgi:hypothetical protein